jgi:hypothetical protein
MRCGWLFVSPDPEHIRRCQDCKQDRDAEYVPRSATLRQVDGAVTQHFESPSH